MTKWATGICGKAQLNFNLAVTKLSCSSLVQLLRRKYYVIKRSNLAFVTWHGSKVILLLVLSKTETDGSDIIYCF